MKVTLSMNLGRISSCREKLSENILKHASVSNYLPQSLQSHSTLPSHSVICSLEIAFNQSTQLFSLFKISFSYSSTLDITFDNGFDKNATNVDTPFAEFYSFGSCICRCMQLNALNRVKLKSCFFFELKAEI